MPIVAARESLAPDTFLWDVEAPDVARAAEPGQFVMVRLSDTGERIPLTIADFDRKRGLVTVVVKVVGKTTEEMSRLPIGAPFLDFIGPLGSPTKIIPESSVILVGGGIGIAPLFPILRGFRATGTKVATVIGFRTAAGIFWRERFTSLSNRFLLATEDGSQGIQGTVVDGLKKMIATESINGILAIGPIPMMQAVAEFTRPLGIKTYASMNPIMVDGIGMCGSCRVTVDGKVLFACVDGPDMDAHKVDFEELKIRQKRFQKEERTSLKKYHQECALKRGGFLQ